MKMNIDLHIGQEELEKKKSFFEDQQSINSKLERDIDLLDQGISELSIRLTREDANRVQFQDEVTSFRFIIKHLIAVLYSLHIVNVPNPRNFLITNV